ncbi:MAG: hypothetical protein ACJASL_005266 [Paraglaciecola sp.]|jgi:hypothetical protein
MVLNKKNKIHIAFAKLGVIDSTILTDGKFRKAHAV